MDVKFSCRISELPNEIKSYLGDTGITIVDSALLDKPAQKILSTISKEWQKSNIGILKEMTRTSNEPLKFFTKLPKISR